MTDLMEQRLWFGLTRWTWVRIAYLVVIVSGVVGLWMTHSNARDIRNEVIERQARDCVLIASQRAAIMQIVERLVAIDEVVTVDEKALVNSAEASLYRDSCTVTR